MAEVPANSKHSELSPSLITLKEAYDDWHSGLPFTSLAESPWHELAKPHVPQEPKMRILEIGCGSGQFCAWLMSHRPELLLGADLSPVALRIASKHWSPAANFHYLSCDIQRIPMIDGFFDLVVSCETVEHVPQPLRAIEEIARVLRTGGTLILTTPNYLGTMGLYRLYRKLRGRAIDEGGQPLNNLTSLPRTCRWVRQAGLTIEYKSGVGHYIPFPGRRPIRLKILDHNWPVLRSLAYHSIVVARKSKR